MKAIATLVLLAVAGLCSQGAEAPADQNDGDAMKAVETYDASVGRMLSVLRDDSVWEDASRQKDVIAHVQALARLRAMAAVSILVKHIDYSPDNFQDVVVETHPRPTEVRFPVLAALRSIGLPAVQAILDEMKVTDPSPPSVTDADARKASEEGARLAKIARRAWKLPIALAMIYAQGEGGHASQLVRARYEMELQKATPQQKAVLLKYNDSPAFRPARN
jgi:hypothetical protein